MGGWGDLEPEMEETDLGLSTSFVLSQLTTNHTAKDCSLLAHSRCSVNKPQGHTGFFQSSWSLQLYTWQREACVNSPGRAACLPGSVSYKGPGPVQGSPWRRQERSPCPQRLPRQLRRLPRGVSKPGAGPATSVGTPPAHSLLPWRPTLFGQVTLTDCSTMLLHTPGLL